MSRSASRTPSVRASSVASTSGGTPGPSSSSLSLAPPSSSIALLPFAKSIIRSIVPSDDEALDEGDALILLAKGLGLRSIVAHILKIYDAPTNLVLVVNATAEEEAALSEDLTTLGVRKPGLRSVTYGTSDSKRKSLYASGGLLSVTSQILIVDMLKKVVPIELITGLVILHAEDVTPLSIESFICDVFRDSNRDGFIKAFSDNAEAFAIGLSPLQKVMGQLQVRKVELWPRFHKSIIHDLGQRKADVVELHQPLSRSMRNIQNAIVECLDATLTELSRSASGVEVDQYTLDNAIFKAFDVIVQRQLQSRWHQLSWKTKGLVSDLKELRTLLNYLISYDSIAFRQWLEQIIASQSNRGQDQSPWLLMDAANVILNESKARAYIGKIKSQEEIRTEKAAAESSDDPQEEEHYSFDSDEEDAAFAAMGFETGRPKEQAKKKERKPEWLPPGIEPVLEEQPKWHLLREVLEEIEQDIYWTEDKANLVAPNNTVLIMTSTQRTCSQVRQYLATMEPCIVGGPAEESDEAGSSSAPGRRMMMALLKDHFWWKGQLSQVTASLRNGMFDVASGQTDSPAKSTVHATNGALSNGTPKQSFESDALKRKQIWERGAAPPNKRRRQRGGMAGAVSGGRGGTDANSSTQLLEEEASEVNDFIQRAMRVAEEEPDQNDEGDDSDGFEMLDPASVGDDFEITHVQSAGPSATSEINEVELENFFGILSMDNLIVVRPYRGDSDDYILQELRPRFIIMYDPDPAFVRRIEMYRSTMTGVNPRVYFLMYAESIEEQKYLSSLRREKESFEKLIREKSIMALPLTADRRPADESADERMLRSISSRVAGGQRGVTNVQPKVIIDMREFRSSLPGILHKAGIRVEPCTLQVGDYILSPEMAVERKALPDLISSFNSGRLYAQCENMSVHYQHPILLIEFGQDKNFSLQTMGNTKSSAAAAAASGGGTGAGTTLSNKQITSKTHPAEIDIQTKLVMLTAAFPRLRILWSSSPYATADMFAELKSTYDEPEMEKVALVGLGSDLSVAASAGTDNSSASAATAAAAGTGLFETTYSLLPSDLLQSMPGITSKNVRHVMNSIRDLDELCDLDMDEVQEIIGVEPGRLLWNFVNKDLKGERKSAGGGGGGDGGQRNGGTWSGGGSGRGKGNGNRWRR